MSKKYKCEQIETITELKTLSKTFKEDLDTIKKNTEAMLRFKWQIMGGTAVVVAIIGSAAAILQALP